MNIQEYTDYIKAIDPMVAKADYNWRRAYDKMNYPSVLLGAHGHLQWQEVHAWCQEQFGKEHYTWTGSRFWFDQEKDAVLFALRWA